MNNDIVEMMVEGIGHIAEHCETNQAINGGNCQVDHKRVFYLACEFSSKSVVHYLMGELDVRGKTLEIISDSNKDTIFHCACRGGNLGIVKHLLECHSALVAEAFITIVEMTANSFDMSGWKDKVVKVLRKPVYGADRQLSILKHSGK